jgi:FixJ family two-component response regulator
VRLGGMSGLDLSSHLAAAGSTVPIILMTGHDDSAWREEAVRAGAVAYLHKPFADETLIDAVQRALGSRRP